MQIKLIIKSDDFKIVKDFWEDYQMNDVGNATDIYDQIIEVLYEDYIEYCCEQETTSNILNTATFMVTLFTIIRGE